MSEDLINSNNGQVSLYYLRSFSFSFSAPRRTSDPGSLSRLFSPLPTAVHALILIARRRQPLSSLVDSHRIAPTHAARRSQQLTSFCFFYFCNQTQSPIHAGLELKDQR